jgi:hypothetical protein
MIKLQSGVLSKHLGQSTPAGRTETRCQRYGQNVRGRPRPALAVVVLVAGHGRQAGPLIMRVVVGMDASMAP